MTALKKIKVRIAIDRAWRRSYWTPGADELAKIVREALSSIETQLRGLVTFELALEEIRWRSANNSISCDFPAYQILQLKKHERLVEIWKNLLLELKKLGIKLTLTKKQLGERVSKFSERSQQFWYLMGFLHSFMLDSLLRDLKKRVASEGDLILGFTGRQVTVYFGGCLGLAYEKGHHLVIPLQWHADVKRVIIHEIGHLLGAIHPRSRRVVTVMQTKTDDQTIFHFDKANLKRIRTFVKKSLVKYR